MSVFSATLVIAIAKNYYDITHSISFYSHMFLYDNEKRCRTTQILQFTAIAKKNYYHITQE